jgi:ParB family chromosome partitioning protein
MSDARGAASGRGARRGLGRGLDALISSGAPAGASGEIPLGEIDASDDQPRTQFSNAGLEELAVSVAEHGVLQPIVVERVGRRYRIIAGERRFRAAQRAGLNSVPALVRQTTNSDRLTVALVENLQREDLTPIEEAAAFKRLIELSGMSQEQLAQRVGKHPSTIANSLRLLGLPLDMQAALAEGAITAGHARALLSVPTPADRQRLFAKLEGLSVREAEAFASRLRGKTAATDGDATRGAGATAAKNDIPRSDPHLQAVQQELMDHLGTKVSVKGNLENGKIEISYYSTHDLERIAALIHS